MGNTLKVVKQTHKAILFENFNNWQKNSLNLAMVLKTDQQDASKQLENLHKLEVRSFDEFVDKFVPKIYEKVEKINGVPKFRYTLDENEGGVLVPLTSHAYYKYLAKVYADKQTSDASNREFDDSDISEIMMPKHEQVEAENLRQEQELLVMQRAEAINKGENPSVYNERLFEISQEIGDKGAKTSLGRLNQYINSLDKEIVALDHKEQELAALPPGENADEFCVASGVLDFDRDGNAVIMELPPPPENDADRDRVKVLALRNEGVKLLTSVVNKKLEEAGVGEFTKEMVIANYLPVEHSAATEIKLNLPEIQAKKNELTQKVEMLESTYAQAQKAFITLLRTLLPRILGVKIFFDHATVEGGETSKLPEGQGLIVANCTPERLMQTEADKQNFVRYVTDYLPEQIGNEHVWLAILPHVVVGDYAPEDAQIALSNANPFDTGSNGSDPVDMATLVKIGKPVKLKDSTTKEFFELMEKGKILTVFNPAVAKDAPFTFSRLSAECIRNIKERLSGLNYNHAVFAFPNFTLIEDKSISISAREDISTVSDDRKAPVGPVYIDAAYVAAGLIVASQQPRYLKARGLKVEPSDVCVRLSLDSLDISNKLTTKFNREMGTQRTASLKAETADRFGFMFCGDNQMDGATKLKNSYVLCARTLKQEKGVYVPLCKTLVSDFVLSYMKAQGQMEPKKFQTLFENTIDDWRRDKAQNVKTGVINSIIQGDDVIAMVQEESEASISIQLSGGEAFVNLTIND